MQRAAAGLAYAVLDLLGSAYGRRVLLLVGSGDNGGDALYAGALLARRGCQVEAWLLSDRAHEAGVAALRAAGGRVVRSSVRQGAPSSARPDVVVDGIVGIGGRAGLRRRGGRRRSRRSPGVPVVAVDTPSGVDVDTGELDGAARHAPTSPSPSAPTRSPTSSTRPPRPAASCTSSTSASTCPPAPVEALQPEDVAALLPRPAPRRAEVHPRRGRRPRRLRAATPAPPCSASPARPTGLCGMVRYVGDRAVADRVREAHPEVVGEGRVQAWVVGSGGGEHAGDELAAALADGVPVVVDADALAHVAGRSACPAVLTPHAGELAAMLGAERADGRGAARSHHARRAADDATTPWSCSRAGTRWSPSPDGRVRATTTGAPWLATAGAGDVLGGLVGALLAAGLEPYDAASVGSWLHGAAATLASRGGPIVAGEVARPCRRRPAAAVPRLTARRPTPVMGESAPMSPSPVARAEIVVDLAAIRHNVATLRRASTGGSGADDDGGQGRRLRPRHGRGRPRRPRGRRRVARRRHHRRGAGAARGRRHRPGAVLADRPGRGLRRPDRRRTSTSPPTPSAELDEIAGGRPRPRPPGPGPAQGRHRALPRRRDRWPTGRTLVAARPRRRGGRHAGGSPASGPTSRAATSPTTPPTTPRSGPSATRSAVAEAAGLRPEVRHLANSAARAAAALVAVRPGAVRAGVVRPRPGARPHSPDLGLVPAMTARATPGAGQAARAPARASPTATPGPPTQPTTRRPGAGRVRRRRAAARLQHRRGLGRRQATAGARADLHGPVRRRPRAATEAAAGDEVVLFGTGRDGEPTAQDWAEACGTISYEIVTRIGGRMTRRHVHADGGARMSVQTQDPGRRGRCRRHRGGRHRRRGRPAPPGHRRAAGAGDATPFGSLRSRADHRGRRRRRARCTSRSTSTSPPRTPDGRRTPGAAQPPLTVVFCHGYALNLDCWHFQRAGYRGLVRAGLLRPALPRPLRPLDAWATPPSTSSAATCKRILDEVVPEGPVVLVGHSMGGMTIIALAEQHPELFGDRVVGVGADLHHRRRPRPEPDPAADACRCRSAARSPTARSRCSAAATGASTGCAGWAAAWPWSPPTCSPSATPCPAAYVDFVDQMLSGTPFEVVAEFFPELPACSTSSTRSPRWRTCRPRSSAAPPTGSPRSGTAASCTPTSPARRCWSARRPATW